MHSVMHCTCVQVMIKTFLYCLSSVLQSVAALHTLCWVWFSPSPSSPWEFSHSVSSTCRVTGHSWMTTPCTGGSIYPYRFYTAVLSLCHLDPPACLCSAGGWRKESPCWSWLSRQASLSFRSSTEPSYSPSSSSLWLRPSCSPCWR